MAEEHEHTHGLGHGHHGEHTPEKKDKDRAIYWGLGLGAAGLVVAVLLFMNGGQKKQASSPTVVNGSTPFIPNPSDVSIGSNASPLYWPVLVSGTPSEPHHHHGTDNDDKNKKKHSSGHGKSKQSNDHKGYGKSPTGASHGHTVTTHTHNPVVAHGSQHTKGKQNG